MTLSETRTLHAFSAWASNRIFDAVAALPEEQYLRDMKTSHRSIHGTLVHMVSAEKVWLALMTGSPDTQRLVAADVPSCAALRSLWEKVGYDTAKFLGGLSDRKLQETFTVTSPRGEAFTHTYGQAFQHVVDHGSYHRGQVVAMLRQLGVAPPATGLIGFYREIAKKP